MFVDVFAAGCPNACRHCTVNGHPPDGGLYSLEELRAIAAEWEPIWVFHEPTAHPDFPETFCRDIQTEHGGWLPTNGYGLARRQDYVTVLERLHCLGIETVAFTLHGLREHHDWFVCRDGAFDDIVLATRRVRDAGFLATWQIYLDRVGVDGIPSLVEMALQECGEQPTLALVWHRVSPRLWRYEQIRPTYRDVIDRDLLSLVDERSGRYLANPESLTAAAWLEKWRQSPDADGLRHPFEPPTWPPDVSFEGLTIHIHRDREVYLDPMCSPPIYLGHLSEGKDHLLGRLAELEAPPDADIDPDDIELLPSERERLHSAGYSVRYLAISKARQAKIK